MSVLLKTDPKRPSTKSAPQNSDSFPRSSRHCDSDVRCFISPVASAGARGAVVPLQTGRKMMQRSAKLYIFQTADCWKGSGEKTRKKGVKHLDPVAAALCRKLTSEGVTRPWVQKFFVLTCLWQRQSLLPEILLLCSWPSKTKRLIHQVNCILVFLQDGSRLRSTEEPASERFLLRCLLVNGLERCYTVCYFQSGEPLVRNGGKK